MTTIAISISILVLAVILVTVLLIIVGVKVQHHEGSEDVIKKVYVYLVLFATLMMTIGGSVSAFMAVADIVSPSPYHQTYEDFRNMEQKHNYVDPEQPDTIKKETISEEELKIRYDAMVAAERERYIHRAKNSLIKSFGWIVIPLPIFILFQRRLAQNNL